MADTIADLLVKIGANTDEFNTALGKMDQAAKDKFGNIKKYADKLAVGMGAASVAIAGIGTAAVSASSDFELLRKRLELVEGSTTAANAKFEELMGYAKASTAFSLDQFVTASNVMENLSKGSSSLIPAIAGMAEALGTDLNMAANQVARAMNGDQRAFLVLERQLGITAEKLTEFDAAYGATGTTVQQNGEILSRYLNEKYGGNLAEFAKTNKSLMGEFQLTIKELGAEIGDTMLPVIKDMTSLMIELIDKLKSLDPETKKAIGSFLLFAPPILAAGAALIGIAGSIGSVITALGGMPTVIAGASAAATGFAANFTLGLEGVAAALGTTAGAAAALTLTVGGLVAAGLLYNEILKEQINLEKELQNQIQEDDRQFRKYINFKKTGQIEEKDIADAIVGARAAGDKEAVRALRERIQGSQEENKILRDNGMILIKNAREAIPAEIDAIKKRMDLDMASSDEKKKYIRLLREEANLLVGEAGGLGPDEQKKTADKAHQLRVEAHNLEKQMAKDSADIAKKTEDEKIAAIKKTEAERQKAAAESKRLALEDYKEQQNLYNEQQQAFANNDKERQRVEREALDIKKQINDEVNRITMSETDYKIYKINQQVEEYRRQGAEEVDIAKYIAAKKKELLDENIKENKKATDEANKEAEKLLQTIDRIGGKASPLLTLQQVGDISAAQFADKKKTTTTTNAAPDLSKLTSANVEKTQEKMTSAPQTQNYNITIGNIKIEGKQAEALVKEIQNATGIGGLIDQTDTVE